MNIPKENSKQAVMKETKKKDEKKNAVNKKEEHGKYETMSQSQNRSGKGRQKNGSDGGNQVIGNNH